MVYGVEAVHLGFVVEFLGDSDMEPCWHLSLQGFREFSGGEGEVEFFHCL